MKTATKVWLIIAAALVLTGTATFSGVMTMLNWDFSKLSTSKFQTNAYAVTEAFQNIAIQTDTADITFILSEKSEVVCKEPENAAHTVAVDDGTLTIRLANKKKWYEHIGINFETPKITVYLPRGEYDDLSVSASTGDITIPADYNFANIFLSESTGHVTCFASAKETITVKATTGDIRMENITTGQLDLSVTTGRISLSGVKCQNDASVSVTTGDTKIADLTCKNLITNGNTGDVDLASVIAFEKFSISRSTGDVRFNGCDAAEISVVTDTGDVKGSLLSDKVFIATTDTGSVHVPKTVTGGRCEITTDTGNIKITTN